MNIKQLIEEWETVRRRTEGVENLISSLPSSSDDHLIKTEDSKSGMSLSDSEFSQLWAGDSRLALDGLEGKALLISRYRAGIKSRIISLMCDTLTVGQVAANPEHWFSSKNTLLSPVQESIPNIQIVIGNPVIEYGQTSVNLKDLITTTSLMINYNESAQEDWSTKLLRKLKNG